MGATANALAGKKAEDLFVKWGVAPGPALWPTVLRILFVIDGRIDTSTVSGSFGLGYVLETLRDDSFAWWVRFRVQVVRRDDQKQILSNPADDANYTEGEDPQFDVMGFRFTEANFSLDEWDQVWLFGDYPTEGVPSSRFNPLGDDELKLLAEWMDRGGGVFAAGDHWILGSSMCSRIPRVRTMRRWTPQQGVPAMEGDTRHETLQHGAGQNEDAWEGDTIPQPVELVYRPRLSSVLARPPFPHSLLSTATGVIDRFPDHMHEGDVVQDDLVELDNPLDIPGYERPEYPLEEPQVDPGTVTMSSVSAQRLRPRPHVVAYGRTTNVVDPQNQGLERLARVISSPFTKRFGIVGAYDGDGVGIGRVVVDSTWHHWFSYNLHGFVAEAPPTTYQLMQAYYRNVAIWLATQSQRQSFLFATTWGPVVSDPMAFPPGATRSIWAVGKRAVEVISRTVPPAMLSDFVGSLFRGRAEKIFGVPREIDPAAPYAGSIPIDLALRAIVGGIASALIEPACEYRQAEGRPRRLLDPGAIARHAVEGAKEGQVALAGALRSFAVASHDVAGRVEDAFRLPPQEPIPVDLVSLRVVLERLQFPDPTDPALLDGRRFRGQSPSTRLTITVRVVLGGSVAGYAVIDEIEVPPFHAGGAFIDLGRVVYEGVVQSGESLTIEVAAGAAGRERVAAEQVRFTETLEGDPSSWIGRHEPSRNQPWRVWYSIEKTGDNSVK